MSKFILVKRLTLDIHQIFNQISQTPFYIGMSNPNSLFQNQVNSEYHTVQQKKFIKKQNQKKAGKHAQQDGENVKNSLAVNLSYKGNVLDINHHVEVFLKTLQISQNSVSFINSKAHSDGKIRCAKSDIKASIHFKSNSVIQHQISVKSTFASTHLSVHSVETFIDYLSHLGITASDEVIEFLTHLTNSESHYLSKPQFIFSESKRRKRFTWEEINHFNPLLWIKTKEFFSTHALVIMNFLISIGGETNPSNFATLLAFCNKKVDNLMFVDIQKLITYLIQESMVNDSFCVLSKPTKNGITTISLFNGFIVLQMKGSGKGAAYHSLQFKINGTKIKKLRESNLI